MPLNGLRITCSWIACVAMAGLGNAVEPYPSAGPGYAWPYENRVGQFHIHADAPLDCRTIFAAVGPLSRNLQDSLGMGCLKQSPSPSPDIHIFLFRNRATFQQYLAWFLPDAPLRPALFIKHGAIPMVFAYCRPELPEDLRHECTHALLHLHHDNLPLWLDEGLAEYFEHTGLPVERPQFQEGGELICPDLATCQELERITNVAQMTERHYTQAHQRVRFMLQHSPQTRQQFQQLLREFAIDGELSN